MATSQSLSLVSPNPTCAPRKSWQARRDPNRGIGTNYRPTPGRGPNMVRPILSPELRSAALYG